MREFLYFVASLAGAAMLTALAVLNPQASLFWRAVFWISAGLVSVLALGIFADIIRRRRAKVAAFLRARLIPFLLLALFLAGIILVAAAVVGFFAYRGGTLSTEAQPRTDSPVVQSTQPIPQPKHYFPGEKEDLRRVLSDASEVLNGEGLTSANDAFRLTSSWNPPQKPQLQEMLSRLESIRKMARNFYDKLYYDIIQKTPRFKPELREVIGDRDLSDQDSKLMQFQRKMEMFHRELSILNDRYDRLTPDDRDWTGQLIFRSEGAAVYGAALQMQGWINECNQRIDQMRELLR